MPPQVIEKRSDDSGNDLWFPTMLEYFDGSPYALKNGVSGEKGLYEHFRHRQDPELKICREVFPNRSTVPKSKKYFDAEL